MTNDRSAQDGPVGIGGWLILPIIGLFLTPVAGLMGLAELGATFSVLDQLAPVQAIFVVLETVINAVIQIVAPVVLLILLFGKRAAFPRLYVILMVFSAIFVVADLIAAWVIFNEVFSSGAADLFNQDTIRSLLASAITVCVWVPYMLNSKRVQNTFVN